jgi:hypothetical protein
MAAVLRTRGKRSSLLKTYEPTQPRRVAVLGTKVNRSILPENKFWLPFLVSIMRLLSLEAAFPLNLRSLSWRDKSLKRRRHDRQHETQPNSGDERALLSQRNRTFVKVLIS